METPGKGAALSLGRKLVLGPSWLLAGLTLSRRDVVTSECEPWCLIILLTPGLGHGVQLSDIIFLISYKKHILYDPMMPLLGLYIQRK